MFNTYNPTLDYYRNQMAQSNNFNNGFQMNYQPMRNQFVTKIVGNIEEAKAHIIDAMSTYLFVDINSGKIYMKRMNDYGHSDFFIYSITPNETITKDDPLVVIDRRLTNIEEKIGGLFNVQSISNDSDVNATKNDGINAKTESDVISKSTRNDERKKQ